MNNYPETIAAKDYLAKKGIPFRESNGEIITKCLFGDCDKDSKGNEAHLYFNAQTGQYICHKCGEKGNLITLAKALDGNLDDVLLHPKKENQKITSRRQKIDVELVEKCHQAMPREIREYLNKRGIPDDIINAYKLGWGSFYEKEWITIPIPDENGKYQFFKLKKNPFDESESDENKSDRFMVVPFGKEATIFGWDSLKGNKSEIVICEGELDRLVLIANGIPAITSTAGVNTFKDEWIPCLSDLEKIYIAFDKDGTGEKEAEKKAQKFGEKLGETTIYKIALPDRMTEGKDITDYFTKYEGNPDELFALAKFAAGRKPVDTSQLKPLTIDNLKKTLGLTIKQDNQNKLLVFLCQLSAYTEDCQFNISFNAPSSTGKSYIPLEIAKLFPKKDLKKLAYCSPTAFFHEVGDFDPEFGGYKSDLSRKIIIFTDQPHNEVLARLRPLLSHDEKEINAKITDKDQKHGLRTKNIFVKGFPSVIFCTTGLKIDEQEATRFLLLSPETSEQKIREGIEEVIKKETDKENYQMALESEQERTLLKERIWAIKSENIKDVKISCPEKIKEFFLKDGEKLIPKRQRDIKRFISIIKSITLLNLWWRNKNGSTIIADETDIEEAKKIWEEIAPSLGRNLPPYVYHFFRDIILPTWEQKKAGRKNAKIGLTRGEILKAHHNIYRQLLDSVKLRQEILPMLEAAGMIAQEKDPENKVQKLVYPSHL